MEKGKAIKDYTRLSAHNTASVAVSAANGAKSLATLLEKRLAGLTSGGAGEAAGAVCLGPRRPPATIDVEQQCSNTSTKGARAEAEEEAETKRREQQRMLNKAREEQRRLHTEVVRLRQEVTSLSEARKRVKELEEQLAAASRRAREVEDERGRLQQEVTHLRAKAETTGLAPRLCDMRNGGVFRTPEASEGARTEPAYHPSPRTTPPSSPGHHAPVDDEEGLSSPVVFKAVHFEYLGWRKRHADIIDSTEADVHSFTAVVKDTRQRMKTALRELDKIHRKFQPAGKASTSKFSVGITEVDLDKGYTDFFKGASATRSLQHTVSEALGKAEGWVVCNACNAGIEEK
eukprot:Hpha_TRINITY_DN16254_c8_g1::TRINITY_DN16254_c8_g1_i1::g.13877::m.13877